ncbi:D-3-phosphoglycerate dehydrogenase [Cutibacterium acnes JCM 18920]|nr:D-3-phosphoglycerate dehydrogenase [Cutibacterium acnes JCM 18918]GAE80932.1 D-3-phosphoglycerate dehydrogenase [Cutibacterium acnes JCM 18920]
MLGAEDFAKMKDGATFINTARGAICDQDASSLNCSATGSAPSST